jgi:DNA-binding NtrC family response regulator
MSERILIVEDEGTLRESLCRVLEREGYGVVAVDSAEPALELLQEETFDLVITDIILPGITGIELIKRVREAATDQPSIVMTAYASLETAVETLRAGAYDYIVKPIIHEEMKQTVRNALKMRALQEENVHLKKQVGGPYDLSRIIGDHPDMLKIKESVKKAAEGGGPVLVVGEVGTGKRLIARAIHGSGPRSRFPLVEVNCGALSLDGQEDTLLGRHAGRHGGILQKAIGGTVYLNRIEALSLECQERLLEVLTDRRTRIPGSPAVQADLHIISGMEKDPESTCAEGDFHEELYRRLKGMEFRVPPLRDRVTDLDALVDFFLERYRETFGKAVKGLAPEVRARFQTYSWPGNVLELKNLMERAVLLTRNEWLQEADFPSLFRLC